MKKNSFEDSAMRVIDALKKAKKLTLKYGVSLLFLEELDEIEEKNKKILLGG